jgi:ankyrin repeat protein
VTVRGVGRILCLVAFCAVLLGAGALYLHSRERLHRLVLAQDVAAVVHYAASGRDLNVPLRGPTSKGREGWTPLHVAIAEDLPRIVEILVRHGADVGQEDRNGYSPLLLATRFRRVDSVVVLLAGGADPNQNTTGRMTPLMYAARYGDDEVIRELIAAGADVNARNRDGWSPLMIAAAFAPSRSSLDVLLSAGADPEAVTCHGRRAVDIARQRTDAARDSIVESLQDE